MPFRELAKTIGITEQGLHALIKKGSTNTSTLESIARVLQVPMSTFFTERCGGNVVATGAHSVAGNGNTAVSGNGNININTPGNVSQKIIDKQGEHTRVEVTSSPEGETLRKLASENEVLKIENEALKNEVGHLKTITELQSRLLEGK